MVLPKSLFLRIYSTVWVIHSGDLSFVVFDTMVIQTSEMQLSPKHFGSDPTGV